MVTQGQMEETKFAVNAKEMKGGNMETDRNKFPGRSGKIALAILMLAGLALSMAFPYGIGFVVFVWVIVLAGALSAVAFLSFGLLKDMLSKTATFGYTPTTAYMAGKKIKARRKKETSDEEKKNSN